MYREERVKRDKEREREREIVSVCGWVSIPSMALQSSGRAGKNIKVLTWVLLPWVFTSTQREHRNFPGNSIEFKSFQTILEWVHLQWRFKVLLERRNTERTSGGTLDLELGAQKLPWKFSWIQFKSYLRFLGWVHLHFNGASNSDRAPQHRENFRRDLRPWIRSSETSLEIQLNSIQILPQISWVSTPSLQWCFEFWQSSKKLTVFLN